MKKLNTVCVAIVTILSFITVAKAELVTSASPDTNSFESRRDQMFNSLKDKPLKKAKIKYNWENRGNFARDYAMSLTEFAMKSFWLNEQNKEANAALQELAQYFLDNPGDMYEQHSFHWHGAITARIVEFFGAKGSKTPGLITPETEAKLLEMMFAFSKHMSKVEEYSTTTENMRNILFSENHDIMHRTTDWHFCKLLKNSPQYVDKKFEDGHTAAEHFKAAETYLAELARLKAQKGLFVESFSTGYSVATLKNFYNLYDFAESPTLRKRAGYILDIWWTIWAQEQFDAVHGGAKIRQYLGKPLQVGGAFDNGAEMAWYYLGIGKPASSDESSMILATSKYRLPQIVTNLAANPQKRGTYELWNRELGLAWGGAYQPFTYKADLDYGGLLRYTYCTPDYIMGTWMLECRPWTDWMMISDQNRWQGIIFPDDPSCRVYPQCASGAGTGRQAGSLTYNQHWSVQSKGALITQKLKTSHDSNEMMIWYGKTALNEKTEKDNWIFTRTKHAYLGVKIISGKYSWSKDPQDVPGMWITCADEFTPIIFQVARSSDYKSFEDFQSACLKAKLKFKKGIVEYKSLAGDKLEFYADFSKLPEINGKPVNLKPDYTYKSPYINSKYDSGIVEITDGTAKRTLDFSLP